MKTINVISVILAFILQLAVQNLFSQCRNYTKHVDFSILDGYEYCGDVMGASMYSRDSAEVDMNLEARKKYRILISAQEYLGEPILEVTNKSDKVISLKLDSEGTPYWEVFSENKQKVTLKISFEPRPKMNHGIDAAGCVVLAVGQIGLDEVVDNL